MTRTVTPTVGNLPLRTLIQFFARIRSSSVEGTFLERTLPVGNLVDPSTAPIANAGPDQTVDDLDGLGNPTLVTLDGSGSSDADGAISAFSWTQTSGPDVNLADATAAAPTFNATDVGADGVTLVFALTVTDDDGVTDTDTVTINVTDNPQPEPSECKFDVDGNNQFDALTDGLLILRYGFGFGGEPLIEGATALDCTRCTSEAIERCLSQMVP